MTSDEYDAIFPDIDDNDDWFVEQQWPQTGDSNNFDELYWAARALTIRDCSNRVSVFAAQGIIKRYGGKIIFRSHQDYGTYLHITHAGYSNQHNGTPFRFFIPMPANGHSPNGIVDKELLRDSLKGSGYCLLLSIKEAKREMAERGAKNVNIKETFDGKDRLIAASIVHKDYSQPIHTVECSVDKDKMDKIPLISKLQLLGKLEDYGVIKRPPHQTLCP